MCGNFCVSPPAGWKSGTGSSLPPHHRRKLYGVRGRSYPGRLYFGRCHQGTQLRIMWRTREFSYDSPPFHASDGFKTESAPFLSHLFLFAAPTCSCESYCKFKLSRFFFLIWLSETVNIYIFFPLYNRRFLGGLSYTLTTSLQRLSLRYPRNICMLGRFPVTLWTYSP